MKIGKSADCIFYVTVLNYPIINIAFTRERTLGHD